MEIPRVLVPRYPGVMCALGLLVADVALDYSRSVLGILTDEMPRMLQTQLDTIMAQARANLSREGIAGDDMIFNGTVDMRYQGQAYELTIPLAGEIDRLHSVSTRHTLRLRHALPSRNMEVVNLRLQAVGIVEKPVFEEEVISQNSNLQEAFLGHKTGLNGDTMVLYDRDALPPGACVDGSAVVFQLDSTVYVAPGWSACVDGWRNLVLETGLS